MPIYEFYCANCHMVFNFFSRTINTSKRPSCPRCGRPELDRRMSRFAISRGRTEKAQQDEEELPDLDESRMEQAMAELEREAEGLDEDNPRHMARLMRKLYETSGLPLGERVEEAIRRMEAGEDPERIEEEMGDLLAEEEPALGEQRGGLRSFARRLKPPQVDETIYDL